MQSRSKRKKRQTELGKRIETARIAAGLRQADLAKACGVDNTQIWKWEKDGVTPKAPSLALIASACRCPLENIVGVAPARTAERVAS